MPKINFILVDEKYNESPANEPRHGYNCDLGHHIVVCYSGRKVLLRQLSDLRRCYPSAKILGTTEVSGKNVTVSDAMNQIRRELCNMP